MRDYYRLLGVRPDATQDEIKDAWNFSVKAFHPDKFAGSSKRQQDIAHERTKAINEAYSVLSDSIKRANYDREYQRETRTQSAAASHSPPPPPPPDTANASASSPHPTQPPPSTASRTSSNGPISQNTTFLLFLWLVVSAMLVSAAIGEHPYNFYIVLRWTCCSVFVYSAVAAHGKAHPFWILIFGALAVLYNPIVRVHLDRATWRGVNWFTVGTIIGAAFVLLQGKRSHAPPAGAGVGRSPSNPNAPSNRRTFGDIVGTTVIVALVLFAMFYAYLRRDIHRSPTPAQSRSSQVAPEIRKAIPAQPTEPEIRKAIAAERYPWKTNIVTTVFWIGEDRGKERAPRVTSVGCKLGCPLRRI